MKIKFLILFFFVFINLPLFAQEQEPEQLQEQAQPEQEQPPAAVFLISPPERGEFWFSPSAEIALYSKYSFSYGAGFSMAYGKKVCVGLKAAFFFDEQEALNVLELHFLLRLYLSNVNTSSGPFLQLTGGPALFFEHSGEITLPSDYGLFSIGLCFGWRFLLGNVFFIEPSIRAGYPFIVGGSVSIGLRF